MTAVLAPPRALKSGEPFTVEHFVEWASKLELDDGEPWVLEPFQIAFVEDLFALGPSSVAWLVLPEDNGKTTLVAGIALYHIQHTPSAYVPVAASSREQAEWLYRQAEGFVFRSGLSGTFKCLEGYRRIRCDQLGSRIQVFAAGDREGDGIIPTLAILDELHRHRDLGLYRTWLGKLRKRGAQLVAISTAGEVASEFEIEREALRQKAEDLDRDGGFVRASRPGALLHEWALQEDADVEDMVAVKAANPFSGVTVESLAEKRGLPGMTVNHWARFTCNVASRSEAAAITEAEWFAAISDEEIPAGEPIDIGLDVAWKWDTTAIVPLWAPTHDRRLFGEAIILEPPRDGGSLDPNLVEHALLTLHARNPIATVVMDTTRAEQLAEWISATLGATVIDRPQTNAYACVDYERFMEGLRQSWLKHSGDQGLTSHVLNAVTRLLPGGGSRFDRPHRSRQARQGERVIDGLSAAAMVNWLVSEPRADWGVLAA